MPQNALASLSSNGQDFTSPLHSDGRPGENRTTVEPYSGGFESLDVAATVAPFCL